jgi:RNA polymerase sigma factor (sigma-70 family)
LEASALPASVGLARARIGIGAPLLRLRSDEQLVTLFRAGNDEAFRVIHDRYRARLLGYARQMLATSHADPEDAVQEIFVRAYANLRSNGRELALRAWLYRIAHNRCIDDLRRPNPPTTEAIDEIGAGAGGDPHDRVEQRDALRRLIVDVQRLPDQQRSALLMRELGGVTYADVADALGVSVPAVKSLLVRARLGLAQANEARDTACASIRENVITAHDRGVRASGLVRRHMRDCADCRRFRSEMRSNSRQLAALIPALGPAAAIAKLLGIGSGAAGGTGAQGAAVGTGAAVSTGTAVGTGAAAGTGIIGGAAGTIVGAGHVATVIAAAVVTAGGAIGIQQISAPAPHHRTHHGGATHQARGNVQGAAAQPASGVASAAHQTASSGAFSTQPIAASLHAVAISQRRLETTDGSSGPGAGHRGTHRVTSTLPITDTQDPDHYVPPSGDTTGTGTGSSVPVTTTDPTGTCADGSVSSSCTTTGTDPCAVPDAGTTGADTGSPTVSPTEPSGATGDWSGCGATTGTVPPTGTSTAPPTGAGSTTGSDPSLGTGSSTGSTTGSGGVTSTGSSSSAGTGSVTGATSTTQPKTTDPFSNGGSGDTSQGQGLSSSRSATMTPKSGGATSKSLQRGSSAAVYSSS